jgi:hypothetical protein
VQLPDPEGSDKGKNQTLKVHLLNSEVKLGTKNKDEGILVGSATCRQRSFLSHSPLLCRFFVVGIQISREIVVDIDFIAPYDTTDEGEISLKLSAGMILIHTDLFFPSIA